MFDIQSNGRVDAESKLSRLLQQVRLTEISLFEAHVCLAQKDATLYQQLTSTPLQLVSSIASLNEAEISFHMAGALGLNRRSLFLITEMDSIGLSVAHEEVLLRSEVIAGPEGKFCRAQRTLLLLHHSIAIYSPAVCSFLLGIRPSEAEHFGQLLVTELDAFNFLNCIFQLPFSRTDELTGFFSDLRPGDSGYAYDRIKR